MLAAGSASLDGASINRIDERLSVHVNEREGRSTPRVRARARNSQLRGPPLAPPPLSRYTIFIRILLCIPISWKDRAAGEPWNVRSRVCRRVRSLAGERVVRAFIYPMENTRSSRYADFSRYRLPVRNKMCRDGTKLSVSPAPATTKYGRYAPNNNLPEGSRFKKRNWRFYFIFMRFFNGLRKLGLVRGHKNRNGFVGGDSSGSVRGSNAGKSLLENVAEST